MEDRSDYLFVTYKSRRRVEGRVLEECANFWAYHPESVDGSESIVRLADLIKSAALLNGESLDDVLVTNFRRFEV